MFNNVVMNLHYSCLERSVLQHNMCLRHSAAAFDAFVRITQITLEFFRTIMKQKKNARGMTQNLCQRSVSSGSRVHSCSIDATSDDARGASVIAIACMARRPVAALLPSTMYIDR